MRQPKKCALFTGDYTVTEVDAALQAESAVVRATLPNKVVVWVITRYDDARLALEDSRLSKDLHLVRSTIEEKLTAAGQPDAHPLTPSLLWHDGGQDDGVRAVLLRQFSAARVRALRPRITQIAEHLLAEIERDLATAGEQAGPVDLVERFAEPLSLTVICDLLGIPDADRAAMREWTTRLTGDAPETAPDAAAAAERELNAYLAGLITARRAEPGTDLLSTLATTINHGEPLDEQEVLGAAALIAGAAHEATVYLLASMVRWPLHHHTVWRELAGGRDLLPRVIDEVLRLDGPMLLTTYRCTIAPIVVEGVLIPAGELVLVSLAAANRDPERFGDPDQFDPDRFDPARDTDRERGHLAFGHGVHDCVGAALARVEAEIGVTELARRFPRARLAVAADELPRQSRAIMGGLRAVPVLLDPA